MKRIQAKDSYEYPYPPQMIYPLLSDIPGYQSWWPREFRVRVLERSTDNLHAKIEVWASGGWFRCETIALTFPSRISIRYYEGVVVGESWWDLQELANGRTKVSYSIDLEPHGPLMRWVASIINISALHSFQFKRVLKGLHRHLDSLYSTEQKGNF